MTRSTDTRVRVRQLAEQLSLSGETPTPSRIRGLLGKGSPNTIVSELRLWHIERDSPPTSSREVLASQGPEKDTSNRGELAIAVAQLQRVTQSLEGLQAGLSRAAAPSSLGPNTAGASLQEFSTEMKKIEGRFEGVQRHMLLQVSEARDEAIKWQRRYQALKDETGEWQTVMRQKLNSLSQENSWLKGKLNLPTPRVEHPPSAPVGAVQPQNAREKEVRYPGHPRAAYSDDE